MTDFMTANSTTEKFTPAANHTNTDPIISLKDETKTPIVACTHINSNIFEVKSIYQSPR